MKCGKCSNEIKFYPPPYLENKIITHLGWKCPTCGTDNIEYFPIISIKEGESNTTNV